MSHSKLVDSLKPENMLSTMPSALEEPQPSWIAKQKEELSSMRDKYLNMSRVEVEKLSAADMVNITFDLNRKQAMMADLWNKSLVKSSDNSSGSSSKLVRSHPYKQPLSSSSSSCKNEASFNILEEIYKQAFEVKSSKNKEKVKKGASTS